MKPKLPRLALALVLTATTVSPRVAAAEESPFPLLGEVASSHHSGLVVRRAPPAVSALDYQIGDALCSVANGSRFTAFEQHLVANGEVWYQVEVSEVTRPLAGSRCPATPSCGWRLARVDCNPLVRVLARNVATVQASTGPKPRRRAGTRWSRRATRRPSRSLPSTSSSSSAPGSRWW